MNLPTGVNFPTEELLQDLFLWVAFMQERGFPTLLTMSCCDLPAKVIGSNFYRREHRGLRG